MTLRWQFAIVVLLVSLGGCGETDPDAPPSIVLGVSACIECGMIVSDERFGTATIIEGDRGAEPMIFDDFNCQKSFEMKYQDLVIVIRWSRDYNSLEWFNTNDGWFVRSAQIQTPMASSLAGFKDQDSAAAFMGQLQKSTENMMVQWRYIDNH